MCLTGCALSASCAVYNAGSKPTHDQATNLVWPTNSETGAHLKFGSTKETSSVSVSHQTSGRAELTC